jgi:hypothetical protein
MAKEQKDAVQQTNSEQPPEAQSEPADTGNAGASVREPSLGEAVDGVLEFVRFPLISPENLRDVVQPTLKDAGVAAERLLLVRVCVGLCVCVCVCVGLWVRVCVCGGGGGCLAAELLLLVRDVYVCARVRMHEPMLY